MLTEIYDAGSAALEVGYDSATQFSREYRRFFGRPPMRYVRTLQYNYHQPVTNVVIDIGHHISWKASRNYYQYGEKSFVGPTDPRYFHANNATFSLLWAF